MTDANDPICTRCGALLSRPAREKHYRWHLTIEPSLEKPTSEFGFWDVRTGRWNPTSRDW